MALITYLGNFGSQQERMLRSMGVVAARAVSLGQWRMDKALLENVLESIVAADADLSLRSGLQPEILRGTHLRGGEEEDRQGKEQ
jgi:hypothetical protein